MRPTHLEVRRMTGRAIGCERRSRPRHVLRIVGMTVGAAQIRAVVTRIGSRPVRKNMRRPIIIGMACIALELGTEMTVPLADRGGTVMAAGTSPGSHVIMIEIDRRPSSRGVADVAFRRGLNMPGRFAECD